MNKEELESLGFKDEWLDSPVEPERDDRRGELGITDYEIVKALNDAGGGEAVDHFLTATWNAWCAASSLVSAADYLFRITTYGDETEEWDRLTTKMFEEILDDMHTAFINAEVQIIQYSEDPFDRAENMLESFGYYCADKLESIIDNDSQG